LLEDRVDAAWVRVVKLCEQRDVLAHGEARVEPGLVSRVADEPPPPLVREPDRHVFREDVAARRPNEAGDHFEQRRLPRSVRAEQADDAFRKVEVHRLQRERSPVEDADVL
jgi:hypothetical protein